jgi:hypothetical protein
VEFQVETAFPVAKNHARGGIDCRTGNVTMTTYVCMSLSRVFTPPLPSLSPVPFR